MKVLLRELPQEKSFALTSDFVEGLIGGLPMRVALGDDATLAGQGEVCLDFYIEGDNVFARGTLKAWAELACSRCLGNLHYSIDEVLMVSFLPGGQVQIEGESEVEQDEPESAEGEDTYAYEGEEINVEPLIRDRFLLAIPYAPLCKEECLGLCSKCGRNRNESDCHCDRKVIDPRLASLRDIKV